MLVNSALYQVFYEELRRVFVEKEWNGKFSGKGRGQLSPRIWDKTDPNDKQYVMLKRFGGGGTDDHQYFHRKHIELKPEKTLQGEIDDLAFSKALRYIGIEIPQLSHKSNLRLADEVKILHDQFYLKYRKQIDAFGKPASVQPIIIDTTDEMEQGFQDTLALVKKFYQCINSGKLEECWDMLTSKFKNTAPWYGEYAEFERGFQNTHGIRNIFIFNPVRAGDDLVSCTVYYEDGVRRHIIDELNLIEAMTVKRLDEFVATVKGLRDKLSGIGISDFDKLPLQKLFDPTVSEYIRYRNPAKKEDFAELFPVQMLIWVKRLYICSCILIEGRWYIEDITQEKTYRSR